MKYKLVAFIAKEIIRLSCKFTKRIYHIRIKALRKCIKSKYEITHEEIQYIKNDVNVVNTLLANNSCFYKNQEINHTIAN